MAEAEAGKATLMPCFKSGTQSNEWMMFCFVNTNVFYSTQFSTRNISIQFLQIHCWLLDLERCKTLQCPLPFKPLSLLFQTNMNFSQFCYAEFILDIHHIEDRSTKTAFASHFTSKFLGGVDGLK